MAHGPTGTSASLAAWKPAGFAARTELVEPRIRRLLIEHLGIVAAHLVMQTSLREDLATDSLDLCELVMLIEDEFGVSISDRRLDDIHSYGDLVDATLALLFATDARDDSRCPPRIWTSLGHPRRPAAGVLKHVEEMTRSVVEQIVAEARLAGPGAQLAIGVARATSPADVARVRMAFAHLKSQRVDVHVFVRVA